MNLYSIANSLSQSYGALAGLEAGRQATGIGALRNGTPGQGLSVAERFRLPSSTSVSLSERGRLQSALSELKSTASALNSADKVAAGRASSDNPAISARVLSGDKARAVKLPDELEINVSQLAQSQQLRSQAFADKDSSIVGTGSLRIEFGRFNSASNTFQPNERAARSVSISAGGGTLSGIANALNRADVGLKASVEDDNGSFRLQISATQTGAANAFRISVSDSDGNNRDNGLGLSRLAFDPGEVPNNGRNLQQTRNAQDAELTVDGRNVVSASNQIDTALEGVRIEARETGAARLSLGRDAQQLGRSAQSLVDGLNRFEQQAAQEGSSSARLSNQLRTALDKVESGSGRERLDLAQIGISRSRTGQLELNEDKLQQAFRVDAERVSALLGQAASTVENVSSTALQSREFAQGERFSIASRSGDNPYLAQARLQQFQSRAAQQPTLLSYSPTTQNLYGLSQYLSIAGL